MAADLGGRLEVPRFSWRWAGLNLFAWRATKNVQLRNNEAKSSIPRTWDKTLFRFAKQRPRSPLQNLSFGRCP
jgi:hypothetical protein